MSKKGSGKSRRSMNEAAADVSTPIYHLTDHYAYTCDCGSVHFNLLKSRKIECSGCGTIMSATWKNTSYQEMADTDAG